MEHAVLGNIYGLVDGRTHHRWFNDRNCRMALLLVAQHSSHRSLIPFSLLPIPRNKVHPQFSSRYTTKIETSLIAS